MGMTRTGSVRAFYGAATRSGVAAGTPSTGLDLPGTSGNYLSVPDSADLDITGDLAAMWDGSLDDWTPAAGSPRFLSKLVGAGTRSWLFAIVATTGVLRFTVSANGTNITTVDSSTAPVVADGAALAVGVTWRASDGRTQFWTAPSGTTTPPGDVEWTQLGIDQTANVGSIFVSTTVQAVGADPSGTSNLIAGVIARARVWASIDGTDERLDVNCVGVTVSGTRDPSTFTEAAKGATVTCNGTTWDWTT